MTEHDLAFLDATAQADLVRSGEATPLELVDAAIERIEKVNPEINAVIHERFDRARDDARNAADGPFTGVPVVIKDLDAAVAGEPCHWGNKLLRTAGWVDDHDSYLVARLRRAGFVIVGKTNTPELGLQPTTEPRAYGPTHNPWNTTRGPGGSSGGSAAAVASGMVPVGHAGDGGGSIRVPASACGLFGLKPTRGRVSLGPDQGEAWSGMVVRHAVTRSVRDSATVLDCIAGRMPGDPYSASPPARPFASEVGVDPEPLIIGLRTTTPLGETDPECVAAAEDAAALLESLGHTVEHASPQALDEDMMNFFMTIFATNIVADLNEIERRVGREVTQVDVEPLTWMYADIGKATSGAQYAEAVAAMHAWTRRVSTWWADDGFDLLLTPTMAEPPPRLGEMVVQGPDDLFRAAARAVPFAAYTAPFNITGQPAISLPLYFSAGDNLPIGVQLVADHEREDLLLRVAGQLERSRPWADHRPVVHA
jgi:amidase